MENASSKEMHSLLGCCAQFMITRIYFILLCYKYKKKASCFCLFNNFFVYIFSIKSIYKQ